jgi:hypothetical protein
LAELRSFTFEPPTSITRTRIVLLRPFGINARPLTFVSRAWYRIFARRFLGPPLFRRSECFLRVAKLALAGLICVADALSSVLPYT